MTASPAPSAAEEWRALPSADRLAVLSYLTAGNASQKMHFFNVQQHGQSRDPAALRLSRLSPSGSRPNPSAPQWQRTVLPAA